MHFIRVPMIENVINKDISKLCGQDHNLPSEADNGRDQSILTVSGLSHVHLLKLADQSRLVQSAGAHEELVDIKVKVVVAVEVQAMEGALVLLEAPRYC